MCCVNRCLKVRPSILSHMTTLHTHWVISCPSPNAVNSGGKYRTGSYGDPYREDLV